MGIRAFQRIGCTTKSSLLGCLRASKIRLWTAPSKYKLCNRFYLRMKNMMEAKVLEVNAGKHIMTGGEGLDKIEEFMLIS